MDSSIIESTGIIVLAAGESSRLGSPKQLIKHNGKYLINHAIDAALGTNILPIYVVLGSSFETIQEVIKSSNVTIIKNELWKEGMASSIVIGLKTLMRDHPLTQKAIFMVCDQPFIHSQILLQLQETYLRDKKPIVASQYHDVLGTPVLFHRAMFDSLLTLKGDIGAGRLIKQNLGLVSSVPFLEGSKDIDTHQDLALLGKKI